MIWLNKIRNFDFCRYVLLLCIKTICVNVVAAENVHNNNNFIGAVCRFVIMEQIKMKFAYGLNSFGDSK